MVTCLGVSLASVVASTADLSIQGKELVRCSWPVAGNNLHGCSGPGVSKNGRRWEAERQITRVRIARGRILT